MERIEKTIVGIMLSAFIGVLLTQASTTFHESIHVLVARLLGAKAGIVGINLYTGASGYEFESAPKFFEILVAVSPPIVIFFTAWYLWNAFGKNSIVRAISIVMWLYSTLPSAFPLIPHSDFNYAISLGANPIFIWAIWVIMNGVAWWNIIEEIEDRRLFRW